MIDNHYVPVLKWKTGEKIALGNVSVTSKLKMIPLIEIQPLDNPDKNLDLHLKEIGKQIKDSWNLNKSIFVEVDTLYSNEYIEDVAPLSSGNSPIEFIFNEIENAGTPAIPVYSLSRYNKNPFFEQSIVNSVLKYQRGLCIRLTLDELVNIFETFSKIEKIKNKLNLSVPKIDLIIDIGDFQVSEERIIFDNLLQGILSIPKLEQWRTLTIIGTSFPQQLSNITKTNNNRNFIRSEWKIYKRLISLNLSRIPFYGDYTVVNSNILEDFNPAHIDMPPSIKYTVDEEFLVFGVDGMKASGNNFRQQMLTLCSELISTSKYMGKSFSYGDTYIHDCAKANGAPSRNPTTWVSVNVNHHLEQVIHELFNMSLS